MPSHVPISIRLGHKALGDVKLQLPGGETEVPRTPLPSSLSARDGSVRGAGKLRKDTRVKPAVLVLHDGTAGRFMLRRSKFASLLAQLPSSECALIPVRIADATGPLDDDDWVLLEVVAGFPLDRDASEASWSNPANPHASIGGRATRIEWGEGRVPPYAIFQLGEHPDVTMLRRDLAEALEKTSRGAVGIVPPPFSDKWPTNILEPYFAPLGMFGFGAEADLAESPQSPSEAAASAAAFWTLVAGKGDAGARAVACANPHYAYWLARVVDRGPRDDTRTGTATNAAYANAYRLDVEGGTDEPATTAAVADAKSEPRETKPLPPPVAPREWPAVTGPRYVEVPGDDDGKSPTHFPLDAELRADIDELIGRGLALLGLDDKATPDVVVNALHAYVGDVQAKRRKLSSKNKDSLALGCVLGEQVRRAVGWSWAMVRDGESRGVSLISRDRAVAFYPLHHVQRLAKRGAIENTVALTFNMLVADMRPPGASPGRYGALT